ncbi:6576_t:CDS:1 [Diversispora eburnea]|uniref:6576_t:CDS:1 n=1 Tax=Diversispora eburnea TaxID=1213867 RepID=A0A9N8VLZ2_9GLOM|nr:6576_t:CDS:1 [Diversispora eburnea]
MISGGVGIIQPIMHLREKSHLELTYSFFRWWCKYYRFRLASIQRDNPEMQSASDRCLHRFRDAIQSVHDVGASGLSNTITKLFLGCVVKLRGIHNDDSMCHHWKFGSMKHRNDMLAVDQRHQIIRQILIIQDCLLNSTPINLPMAILFGKSPMMSRRKKARKMACIPFNTSLKVISVMFKQISILGDAISRHF